MRKSPTWMLKCCKLLSAVCAVPPILGLQLPASTKAGKCQLCHVGATRQTAPTRSPADAPRGLQGKAAWGRSHQERDLSNQQVIYTHTHTHTKSYVTGSQSPRPQISLGNTTHKRKDGAGHGGRGVYFLPCFCCWYLLKWVWMVRAAFSEGSLKNLPSLLASGVTLPTVRSKELCEHGDIRKP